jgi:proteasome lid subunit RPN8/RPN11
MRIQRADADALLAHARSGYPHEICGVLIGTTSGGAARVARVVPVVNRETERPAVRYQIAPEDLIAVQKAARAEGLDILGYYHSHPDHPARPSETDRRIAAEGLSDGVVHVVVGVAGGRETTVTAWTFRDASQAFEGEPFEVE